MKPSLLKIILVMAGIVGSAVASNARTNISGNAELLYSQYEAEENGSKLISGSSLAQRYNVDWTATNLTNRAQPQYYRVSLGYNWIGFGTKVMDKSQEGNINQSYGKFLYGGNLGYNPVELPISFSAYINNPRPGDFRAGILSSNLVQDDLIYDITDRNQSRASGFSFMFDPMRARSANLYGLPSFYVDYREQISKSADRFSAVDNKTRELAVAGLNKDNNWLIYRNMSYENYLSRDDNYKLQQIQIGHVDHKGRRKWSALTNWIDVSADGSFSQTTSPSPLRWQEEYDVNFMAIARRKAWDARTFMSFERLATIDYTTEKARVPVYVKGVYGADTTWYLNLGGEKERMVTNAAKRADAGYANNISLGATTFNRSSFTLSPSFTYSSHKLLNGNDSYAMSAKLETASTRRFSDRVGLGAKAFWRTTDDGSSSSNSKSWSSNLGLNAYYNTRKNIVYRLSEDVEMGSGAGYIEPSKLQDGTISAGNVGSYTRSITSASASWTPTAEVSTSVDARYDMLTIESKQSNAEINLNHRFSYTGQETFIRFDTSYRRSENSATSVQTALYNSGEVGYRPDRYNDGLLRYTYTDATRNKRFDLVQRYSLNFFTMTGVIRNYATVSQEYGASFVEFTAQRTTNQYLKLEGRYSPTERYSLYGSVRYDNNSPGGATMYYLAGLNADFKLLRASIDYTYAKRDADNRAEKKLNASVKRSF